MESKEINHVLDQIDNYKQTIEALVSMANVVISDYSGKAWLGRVMRAEAGIAPDNEVTPDLVAQIQDYALISEAKQSLPREQSHWDELVLQVRRYDGKLLGWIGDPKPHDLTLLCNQIISHRVAKFFEGLDQAGQLELVHPFCIIAFNRNNQRKTFIFLKKEHGSLTHSGLDSKLADGIPVPLEDLLQELSAIKFYDAEPNVVYTMAILWDHVFSSLATQSQLRESLGRKTTAIEVNTDQLLHHLRTYFAPPESRDVVRRKWVKDAMESFVRIGLASSAIPERDRYNVSFRRIPADTLIEHFARSVYAERQVTQARMEQYLRRGETETDVRSHNR